MSCNCTTQTPELPTVADDCALAAPLASTTPCCRDTQALSSSTSEGAELPLYLTDAACATEDITILGRVGTRLARFVGTGFISITNGRAAVVSAVPLKIRDLWHNWWKPTATSTPIIGEPLPADYLVVAGQDGNIHGIKGLGTEDSIPVWNATTKKHEMKPLSAVPQKVTGLLPRETEIELVGYVPIANDGEITEVRPISALLGTGIIYLTEQDTVEAVCDCVGVTPTSPNKASVAKHLAFPTANGIHTLKFNGTTDTLYWSADA